MESRNLLILAKALKIAIFISIAILLFKTDERIVFIEINPRFGGGYPLSYLSGANFAKYLIEDFMGKDLEYNEDWKDNNIMLRYDAEVIVDGSSI